ncbi:MAG: tungstate ABC transporter substrate-binding protein WtpA [Methanoculleus sp. SDB]|nr:MAG: tungstate ABC transporter substrate-binding protein WtpA [Methanoculleus sp. SDB]
MKQIRAGSALLLIACCCAAMLLAGCSAPSSEKSVLNVVPAGSLLGPFEVIEQEYEALHPDVDVRIEGHGSIQAIRQVTDLHRRVDVVAVADESLIPEMMSLPVADGEGRYAEWYIPFAMNRMVIAYTNASRYAGEITAENWYDILARPGVRFGFSNPVLDAAGYRAQMVMMLAEEYYGLPGLYHATIADHLGNPVPVVRDGSVATALLPEFLEPEAEKIVIRDGSIFLLSLLDAGGIDYAFEYRSVARQHGLQWIDLPPEIDLGSPELAPRYATVAVRLSFQRFSSIGSLRTGRPIVYAITIPTTAENPEGAADFINFTLERFAGGRTSWPTPLSPEAVIAVPVA